jgi:tetratricopeptide (TPR) repeat protein
LEKENSRNSGDKMKKFVFLLSLLFISTVVFATDEISQLMKEGKWTKAKKIAKMLLKENPKDWSLYLTVGVCSINQKNYNDAIANLSKAAALNPKMSLPKFFLGMIFEEIGNFPKAKEYFLKAKEVEKNKERKREIEKHLKIIEEKAKKEKK